MKKNHNGIIAFFQKHNHVILWTGLFMIFTIMTSRHQSLLPSVLLSATTIIPMIVSWTLAEYMILPHLLHRRRLLCFSALLLMIAVLTFAASTLDAWLYHLLIRHSLLTAPTPVSEDLAAHNGSILLFSKYTFLLLCTVSSAAINFMIDERRSMEQQFHEEQMQEQLKYLRAQINPHFLFNALNCIYTLTMTQDAKASDSVLQLSEMLRYVIDDCRADTVPLTKEIRYIQNYIDFQRIRMEFEPTLTFDVQQADINYDIPPMILQPFIENCFKHSRLVDDRNAWVHITIRQNESGLLFTCDNSKPAATQFSRQSAIMGRQDEERTGIGLDNVQQRLSMLFGDKYSLKVIEDDTHYKTILHI